MPLLDEHEHLGDKEMYFFLARPDQGEGQDGHTVAGCTGQALGPELQSPTDLERHYDIEGGYSKKIQKLFLMIFFTNLF